jgi:hypothetical protein
MFRPGHSSAPDSNGHGDPAAVEEEAGRHLHVDAGRCVSVHRRLRKKRHGTNCERYRVCAISITRVIATYAIIEEYIKHPNDVICTSTSELTTNYTQYKLN